MYQSGTYVVYGCKGVHKIIGTTHLNLEGIPKDKEYYILQAVKKPDGAVYAPVEASKTNMRSVMTKEQAESFMLTAENIHALQFKNPKQREENCRDSIKSCAPDALLQVIKTLMERRVERARQGKKLTLLDLHFMEQAEDILYEELSISLSIPRGEVEERIHAHFPKKAG